MKKKIFSATLAVCLLVISIVGTTIAYFTGTDFDESGVFTAGNVTIELNDNIFVTKDNVKAYPGLVIAGNAKITNTGSEKAYVGAIISLVKDANTPSTTAEETTVALSALVGGIADSGVTVEQVGSKLYIIKDAALDGKAPDQDVGGDFDVFSNITIPVEWGNDQVKIFNNAKIVVSAYGVQESGFANAEAALAGAFTEWAHFATDNTQTNTVQN